MTDLTPEERRRIYEEEKARIEADENAREQARAQAEELSKSRLGGLKIFLIICAMAAFIYLVFHVFQATNQHGPTPSTSNPAEIPEPSPIKTIEYSVLRSWTPGRFGTGMDILVSPSATKSEVMTLAEVLRAKYMSTGQVVINIFDLKEAWQNRDNDNYRQAKYMRHWLAQVFVPPMSGQKAITWVAEGRDH